MIFPFICILRVVLSRISDPCLVNVVSENYRINRFKVNLWPAMIPQDLISLVDFCS